MRTYLVTVLEAKVVVLDVQLQIGKDKLEAAITGEIKYSGRVQTMRTSSRIFFQIILVISSPSSSTTGFATTIFFPYSVRIGSVHNSDYTYRTRGLQK